MANNRTRAAKALQRRAGWSYGQALALVNKLHDDPEAMAAVRLAPDPVEAVVVAVLAKRERP